MFWKVSESTNDSIPWPISELDCCEVTFWCWLGPLGTTEKKGPQKVPVPWRSASEKGLQSVPNWVGPCWRGVKEKAHKRLVFCKIKLLTTQTSAQKWLKEALLCALCLLDLLIPWNVIFFVQCVTYNKLTNPNMVKVGYLHLMCFSCL